jgi:nucleotide-binding universal stress UspA family protein
VFRRILVGTDGSATATEAIDRAVDVAAQLGASLTIMSAGSRKRAETVVEKELARLSGSGVAVDTRVAEAEPATAQVDAVEDGGYDLLVVGNKGMTGVSRFFLGSVPNKVSHHVTCSLLIVRTT